VGPATGGGTRVRFWVSKPPPNVNGND
jgi:hypothetical protein